MTPPGIRWSDCPHDGGWQYLAMNQVRCRKCNVVRFSPMVAAEMQVIPQADVKWFRGRIAQLEKALEPFGEMGVNMANSISSEVSVGPWTMPTDTFWAAAQALGYLDPETRNEG